MSIHNPKKGEIWLVDFDPQVGSETKKKRPAIVVSENSIGKLPLRIVVPITDWKPQYSSYPWFSKLKPAKSNGLSKDSGADSFQVKSVSTTRFGVKLGAVTADELDEILACVAICIGV